MTDQERAPPASSPSSEGKDNEIWGPYLFNLQHRSVTLSGRHIPLTNEEFALALLLFRKLSVALSRDVIMQTVWGYVPDKPSRILDAHISQIRIRLGLNPENGLRLAAVYRFGYRLERLDAWDGTQPRGLDGMGKP